MRFYENPKKTSEGRMPPRSWYIPSGAASSGSLNGNWRFAFFEDGILPESIAFENTIEVPSCWQLKGYENPNYSNTNYPFPVDPPFVPDLNPTGVYEREFTVLEGGMRTYMVFEGISSCGELYINGKYVGFTEGSHLMAEFDITDYVTEGENTARVIVRKWCAGSYLEDQDHFRYNGIFRDVYILSRPNNHLFDFNVSTSQNRIIFNADRPCDISVCDGEDILAEIFGAEGNCQIEVQNAIYWNAENPYLYTIKLRCEGEVITRKIGFRDISISENYELLINDTPIKIKGVNHHDSSASGGWYMTDSEILRDLELMKRLNINTVRTSHYPPSPRFLDYCDEIGLYVILETDIETHGVLRRFADVGYGYDDSPDWMCKNPDWEQEYISRMQRAYERDKLHPSIIMWSTGNESNHGENFVSMINWLKAKDPSRLIHHEGGCLLGHPETSDVFSNMYSSPEKITAWANDDNMKQPVFLCEFSHSMGNGPGDIWDYTETFYSNKKLIGGCIWEWADHVVMVDGVQKYGGDFEGELTNDGNFCCDGMVFADRSLKAGSYEIQSAFAPFRIDYDNGKLTITNLFDFTLFDGYSFEYEVICDGEVIENRRISANVAPRDSFSISLSAPLPQSCKLGSCISVKMLDKNDTVMGVLCKPLPVAVVNEEILANPISLTQSEHEIIAEGENFKYTFSSLHGGFTSMIINGCEQLLEPTKITYWRAPTDNDRRLEAKWLNQNIWEGENFDMVFQKVYSATVCGNKIVADCSAAGVSRAPFFRYTLTLEFFEDGSIKVSLNGNIRENVVWLARLGFEFKLPFSTDKFRYYGNGPLESYCDMTHHGVVTWHQSDADSEYVNYVRPQEHGNHTQVKRLELENSFNFTAQKEMDICVLHNSTQQLYKATHTDELEKSDGTHIRIDYKNSGIGSSSCGPSLNEKYRLSEKEINFSFVISI